MPLCSGGNSPTCALHGHRLHELLAESNADLADGVPLLVHAELLVGAAKSKNPNQAETRVLAFLAPFVVAWSDSAVEDQYVVIHTEVEALGIPISEADLWIAATVRTAGGILVTDNTREFSRVQNLLLED